MTFTYGFYNSVGGDRQYDATQMADIVKGIVNDGIFSLVGTAMRVTFGSGLTVNVGIGRAWFNGTWSSNSTVLPITFDTADALLPRIDAVVLEVDKNTGVRANTIKIIKGTPASSPLNPALTTGTLKNQYVLAYCRINAGSTTVTSISDQVGTAGTPYVTTGIEPSLQAANATETAAGVIGNKYVTPLGLKNSTNYPNAVPGAAGSILVSNGSIWTSVLQAAFDGWVLDPNTWTFVSADGPTTVLSVNADARTWLRTGMRMKLNQARTVTAYMSMDTNSNSSIGSYTMTDTAVTYTPGKFSNAATLNGTTSKIAIADNYLLKPGTGDAFTFGCWVKMAVPSGANQTIFSSYSQNTFVAGLILYADLTGKLSLITGKNTGLVSNVDFNTFVGRTVIADNTWHYITFTITPYGYVQLYVDGQLETSGYSVGISYAGTSYIRLGSKSNAGTDSQFLNGQIEDVYSIFGYCVDEDYVNNKYFSNAAQTASISFTKKALITNVGLYSGSATLVTMFHGTDYTGSIDGISGVYYSNSRVPLGISLNPDKWKVSGIQWVSQTKTTPTLNSWYGGSQLTPYGLSAIVPIGSWRVVGRMVIEYTTTNVIGQYGLKATISNSETTEMNPEYTSAIQIVNESANARTYRWYLAFDIPNVMCYQKTTFSLNISNTLGTITSMSILGNPYPTLTFLNNYL